jgi:hypothetical protein
MRAVVGVIFTLIVLIKKPFTSLESLTDFPLGGRKKGSVKKNFNKRSIKCTVAAPLVDNTGFE